MVAQHAQALTDLEGAPSQGRVLDPNLGQARVHGPLQPAGGLDHLRLDEVQQPGLTQAGGVRLAVQGPDGWRLLGVPSLRVQEQHACTWHYATDDLTLSVTATVDARGVRLQATASQQVTLLVAVDAAREGLVLAGAEFGDDAALFADGASRGTAWRCHVAADVNAIDLRIEPGVAEVNAWLPWLAHDAGVHFQAPRGLEQFTGGAWGTRDVSQGTVGLLVATGEHAALRATLLAAFAGQHDNGDWPQWFEYLPEVAQPNDRDSNGDVVYWPLLALGEYLVMTRDATILEEPVRFVGAHEFTPAAPLREHVLRAVDHLASRRTRDPRLPSYGEGDWNDSLQPAQPGLADTMCSAWTTILEIESLRTLATGLGEGEPDLRERLTAIAADGETALAEVLLVDGELAGYAVLEEDGTELLVHPHDTRTGLHHGSLQVIHALAGELLDPEAAAAHVALVDEHLDGPHGIYLFDTPVRYSGGEMHAFKRAEAASFWGREIGLMYTHAHLRWIEALTHLGEAERAWAALLKVVPVGVRERTPGARPRQASCYYSSADAVFADRYVAQDRARDLFDADTPFEGGWRVYSSGPGLILRLVTERLLGARFRGDLIEFDPVLPAALGQAVARIPDPAGGWLEVTYHIGGQGHGVTDVRVNGQPVEHTALRARYRRPGVAVPRSAVPEGAEVVVSVG